MSERFHEKSIRRQIYDYFRFTRKNTSGKGPRVARALPPPSVRRRAMCFRGLFAVCDRFREIRFPGFRRRAGGMPDSSDAVCLPGRLRAPFPSCRKRIALRQHPDAVTAGIVRFLGKPAAPGFFPGRRARVRAPAGQGEKSAFRRIGPVFPGPGFSETAIYGYLRRSL